MEDELSSEYDLKSLRVRRLGSGRQSFCQTIVCLEPDVVEMFFTRKQIQAVFAKTPDQPVWNDSNNK